MVGQLSGRVDQCVLRWFGHVARMDEKRDIWPRRS